MVLTYIIGQHDGGWAYRSGDVWSEAYPTHETALTAAKSAAHRQRVPGNDGQILYKTADYRWKSEASKGGDRPEVDARMSIRGWPRALLANL